MKDIILLIEKNFDLIKKNKFTNSIRLPKHIMKRSKYKSTKFSFNPRITAVTKCEPFMSKKEIYIEQYLKKNYLILKKLFFKYYIMQTSLGYQKLIFILTRNQKILSQQ